MSQRIDGNTGGKVEVFAVLNIVKIASLTLVEHGERPDVSGDHVRHLVIDETCGLRVCRRVRGRKDSMALKSFVSTLGEVWTRVKSYLDRLLGCRRG